MWLIHGVSLSESVQVAQLHPTLWDPMDCSPWDSPGQNTGDPFPSPWDLLNPGTEPRSPALQTDSLPAEPQRKPKNTGVDTLSLLQQIFPTQEWDLGLLHCRQILYHLSYPGKHKWEWKSLSTVPFFATPWTIQSMKFSRPEYWSG